MRDKTPLTNKIPKEDLPLFCKILKDSIKEAYNEAKKTTTITHHGH